MTYPTSGSPSTNAAIPLPPPPADAGLTPSDQEFVLQLVRNAVVLGILEIEYRGLKVRISPNAAREGQKHAISGYSAGNWSAPIKKA